MAKTQKYLFIALLLTTFLNACTFSKPSEKKTTSIDLSCTELNLGKVKLNTDVQKEIIITNEGNEAFTIYNDKLYLNYSKGVREDWQEDKDGYIVKADVEYPANID